MWEKPLMTKLSVSNPTYNEIKVLLAQQGKEINDGSPLTIEKGTAIMPPHDFRMVAIRQNCLMAASEVLKLETNTDTELFLNVSEQIFNWCLNGKELDKNLTPNTTEATKTWK